jgi:hypothetical protein
VTGDGERTSKNDRVLSLRLPADLHDDLRRRAQTEERTLTGLLRYIARKYLKEHAEGDL